MLNKQRKAEALAVEAGKGLDWKQKVKRQWNRHGIVYVFLVPVMIHYCIFHIFPLLFSAFLTFTNWSIVGKPKWVGLANWTAFVQDKVAWQSIWNTLVFSFYYIVPTMALGLMLALLVHAKIRFAALFKSLYFLPVVTSFVVLSGIWDWIFQGSESGLMNYVLGLLGIPKQLFFSDPQQAMLVLAALSMFKVAGITMVYYYSGLLSIPAHLYEAARIDGATGFQAFWRITLPLLLPIHFYVAVVTTIGSFQVFDSAFLLTKGGPNYATTTIVYYMYNSGFVSLRLGYASVIAYVLFFIVFTISLIQKKFLGKDVSYY